MRAQVDMRPGTKSFPAIILDLPRGLERELFEYYFNRGLTCRCITMMLGKYHGIDMNGRTLKRRLKDYDLRRRDAVNTEPC